jgi:mannitol/fructose-specific phosphotransferase system IIA component (Ntr-type)
VKLSDVIGAGDVVLGLRGSDIANAASQLLHQTLPKHGLPQDEVQRLIDKVTAREQELPTTCGTGAIPHARDAAITSFIAAIGVNPDGIVEGKRQPRVIIAFLSPESQRSEHLAFLASLSRLVSSAEKTDAIARAATAADVVALLQG